MKKFLHRLGAGILGLIIGGTVLGVTYTQFSPGGALSGTWNSQNINVGAGSPFVTGVLPGANGGSGNAFFSVAGPSGSVKTYTFPNASTAVLTTNTPVTVPQGGTGATTLTGPLKGNGTSAFTAALAADIIGLWSGTCNNTTFLRGDGECAAGNAGTVTSVGLTMPTGFSVANSPITGSGTLGVTTTLNGVLKGNGSGFSASNVSLTTEVTGTLPVGNGGTGAVTLTGPLKGNGTSAFTAATSADMIGLFSGTCTSSSSRYLATDGSCQLLAAGAAGANPTASVGLTAVNGVATTFLRSDGAPALSQAISPTWTGQHIFTTTTPRSTAAEGFRLANDAAFLTFYDTANSVRSGYLQIQASGTGTLGTEVNQPFSIFTNNTTRILFGADGSWDLAGTTPGTAGQVLTSNGSAAAPTWEAGAVIATDNSQTWTAGSCTTSPTITPRFNRVGNLVTVRLPILSCTANGSPTALQLSGSFPSGMTPSGTQQFAAGMTDNGAEVLGILQIASGGLMQWRRPGAPALTGTIGNYPNGTSNPVTFTYSTN
jgi:hypothetical protein